MPIRELTEGQIQRVAGGLRAGLSIHRAAVNAGVGHEIVTRAMRKYERWLNGQEEDVDARLIWRGKVWAKALGEFDQRCVEAAEAHADKTPGHLLAWRAAEREAGGYDVSSPDDMTAKWNRYAEEHRRRGSAPLTDGEASEYDAAEGESHAGRSDSSGDAGGAEAGGGAGGEDAGAGGGGDGD